MLLCHSTPFANVESIDRLGLLPRKSMCDSQVVWLHARSLGEWARSHVSFRHKTLSGAVAMLSVSVPRNWLRRRASGLYTCDRVIPTERIHGSPAWIEALHDPIRATTSERASYLDLSDDG